MRNPTEQEAKAIDKLIIGKDLAAAKMDVLRLEVLQQCDIPLDAEIDAKTGVATKNDKIVGRPIPEETHAQFMRLQLETQLAVARVNQGIIALRDVCEVPAGAAWHPVRHIWIDQSSGSADPIVVEPSVEAAELALNKLAPPDRLKVLEKFCPSCGSAIGFCDCASVIITPVTSAEALSAAAANIPIAPVDEAAAPVAAS